MTNRLTITTTPGAGPVPPQLHDEPTTIPSCRAGFILADDDDAPTLGDKAVRLFVAAAFVSACVAMHWYSVTMDRSIEIHRPQPIEIEQPAAAGVMWTIDGKQLVELEPVYRVEGRQ